MLRTGYENNTNCHPEPACA